MSKAFTKEDGGDEPAVARPRPSGRRLLTPEGHARALEEWLRLRDTERPRLLKDASVGGREALRAVEVATPANSRHFSRRPKWWNQPRREARRPSAPL